MLRAAWVSEVSIWPRGAARGPSASTLTERRYKHGLGIVGGFVHGLAEAAHLGRSLRRKKAKWARPAVGPYRISNGSACTSSSYTPSHVIKAMGFSDDEANEVTRSTMTASFKAGCGCFSKSG